MSEDTLPVSTQMPISDAKFTDSLADDIRTEPSLQNFKDVNSLAKSYVSAQKMIGNSLRIPTDDASPEARAEFYSKLSSVSKVAILPDKEDTEGWNKLYNTLGRPDAPDKYEFHVDEGVELDRGKIDSFKQVAHQLGLTQQQADSLVKFELERNEQLLRNVSNVRETATNALREAFGTDFDNRLNSAKETVKHFGSKHPEAYKSLIEGEAGNNPIVIMMAAELGKLYKESGLIEGTRKISFGVTPAEARQRIDEIRSNPNHAYYNDRDPKHAEAVEYVSKMYGYLGS